ncbi:unnamed protein product [Clonostachys rosea f. rosea IK726]|uniref:Uncharacterized protein n=1 Tax=Clonostachys rosea f. rosea IK726 TaxID=1349383 RepID=A0ACA9UDQ4_BIOOC|nr:unnamed protein product [Clonostachys rosea f. rosea IK726]
MAGNNNDKTKPGPSPTGLTERKTESDLSPESSSAIVQRVMKASGLNARETVERPIKDAFGCQPPHIPYRPNMLLFYRAGMPVEDAPGANIEIIDRDKVISQHRGMTEGRMGPRQWDEVRILHNLLHNLTMNVSWIPIEQVRVPPPRNL